MTRAPRFTRRILLAAVALASASLVSAPAAAQARIGVYDSRAVAIAYGNSPLLRDWLARLRVRLEQARKDGDSSLVARLQAEGRSRQEALHRQGFGTAPVDDLLELVASRLPALRQAAGVEDLVSKWDDDALARHAGAERVDVTMALVDAFEPDDRGRRWAVEVQSRPPEPQRPASRERP